MPCRPGKGLAFQAEGDADEDDSGEAEDIQYKDFFDPAEAPAAPRGLPHTSGRVALHAAEPDSLTVIREFSLIITVLSNYRI